MRNKLLHTTSLTFAAGLTITAMAFSLTGPQSARATIVTVCPPNGTGGVGDVLDIGAGSYAGCMVFMDENGGEAGNDTVNFDAEGLGPIMWGYGGEGNDSVLNGEGGDDTFNFFGSMDGTIEAMTLGTNNDTIFIGSDGANGTINGEDGNDTFDIDGVALGNTNGSGAINGGNGNDVFTIDQSILGNDVEGSATGIINGGTGDDTFTVTESIIGKDSFGALRGGGEGGEDNITLTDVIVGQNDEGEVDAGDGDDIINVNGHAIIGKNEFGDGLVTGGEGEDTITLSGSFGEGTLQEGWETSGETGGTIIIGYGSGSEGTVDGGDDNDTITGEGVVIGNNGHGTLQGGDGDDVITLTEVIIGRNDIDETGIVHGDVYENGEYDGEGMGGNDTITLTNAVIGHEGTGKVLGGYGEDNITVNGPAIIGNQSYSYGVVDGGADNDIISLNGSMNVAVEGFFEEGLEIDENSTIIIGNDYDAEGRVSGSSGNDTISVTGTVIGNDGHGVVEGNSGDDTITVSNSVLGYGEAILTGIVHGDSAEGGDYLKDGPMGGDDTITVSNSIIGDGGTGEVLGGYGEDNITVNGPSIIGNQYYSYGLVDGGADNDLITLSGTMTVGEGGVLESGLSIDENGTIIIGNDYGAFGMVAGSSGEDNITVTGTVIGNQGEGVVQGNSGDDTISVSNSVLGYGEIEDTGVVHGDTYLTEINGLGIEEEYGFEEGPGDDTIIITDSIIGGEGTGKVFGGFGNDFITVSGSVIGEDAFGLVHGGNGTEIYEEPSYNPDDDFIGITDSIIGKYATGKVNGGEGNDFIVINNSFFGYGEYSKGKVTGYSGEDTIIVQGTVIGYNEGKGKVDGGYGNDIVQLNALGEGGGNDMMVTQVTERGKVQGGPGDDIIGVETGVLLDDYATLDGDNKYYEGYNKDELKLFGSGIGHINPGVNIVNFEILRKIDPGLWFYQNDAEFKKTKLEEGTFVLGGKLRSKYTFIKPDAVLETNPEVWGGTGVIKSPYEGYAKVFNRGLISPGGAGFFGKLKIKGDYKSKYDEGGLFVDFDGLQADRLEITHSVYGDTTVFASPSPTGTYGPTGLGPDDGMLVINACMYECTVDGDFLLNGGSVTGGAYVYNLNRFELVEGETGSTIWRLQSDGTITPQSNTFMNALTAAQVQYRYAAQSFHQRMAELRTDGTIPGSSSIPTQFASLGPTYNLGSGSININPDLVNSQVAPQVAQGAKDATRASGPQRGPKKFQLWIRGFGGYSDVDPGVSPGGAGFDERTGGMQVGLGQMIPGYFEKGDQFHFGLIGGMSRTDVDVPGADMDINGVVGGIYGSWFSQSGWYVDAVGMAGPLDFKVNAPSFGVINQSFHGYSAGGSLEAGRGFKIGKDAILEPQAQLTYVHVDHESFSTALGTPVAAVDGNSLVGRLGARLAGTFQGDGQTRYTPFLRASVKYDFLGDNKVQVANTGLRSDVGGVTGEVGGGLTAKVSDKMSLYFNAFYEKGDDIEAVQGTAGAVWTFE